LAYLALFDQIFILIPLSTINSAIADKLRDAFKGQSRSPNMVPLKTGLGVRQGH